MLFSIIVPVYNTEKWLNGCVDSILGQSFGDFELILVDDGSTDRSGEICDSYAARDGRVRVLHRPNGGPSQARNEGLAVMKGDYVIFDDSDDRVETNLLEEVRATLLKKPVDVVVWGYNAVSRAGTKRHHDPNLSLKDVKVKCLRGEWPNALWIKCWKRELFDGVNFPDEVLSGQDMWVTCSLIMKAKSASVIHKSLYNYRLDNPSSISNNLNSRKYYWAMRALLRSLELGAGGAFIETKDHYGISNYAVSALLVHRRDGLLSPEQHDEVTARVERLRETAERMELRARYGTYHSLSRYEKVLGHRGKAWGYLYRYIVSKSEHLCRRLIPIRQTRRTL